MAHYPGQFNRLKAGCSLRKTYQLKRNLLISYSCAHFAVDAGCSLCACLLLTRWGVSAAEFYKLVMLYNLVAFGSQPLFGWILDVAKCQREGMITGVLLTAAGCAAAGVSLVPAALMLGVGNALFHVGAGAGIYAMSYGKASPSGVFIAPGAVGLFAGGALGATSWISPYYATIALCLIAWGLMYFPVAQLQMPIEQHNAVSRPRTSYVSIVLLLLLMVVASRSFIGSSMPVPWKGMEGAPLTLVVTVFAGKSLGGYLADRLGWTTWCGALLLLTSVMAIFYQNGSLFRVAVRTGNDRCNSSGYPVAVSKISSVFIRTSMYRSVGWRVPLLEIPTYSSA